MLRESLFNLNHHDSLTSSKFMIEHISSKFRPDTKGWYHQQTVGYTVTVSY